VVEELELAGYVERERQPDDRRVVRIRLRPASAGGVERAYRGQAEAIRRRLAPFDDAERTVIQDFLRRVVVELRAAAIRCRRRRRARIALDLAAETTGGNSRPYGSVRFGSTTLISVGVRCERPVSNRALSRVRCGSAR